MMKIVLCISFVWICQAVLAKSVELAQKTEDAEKYFMEGKMSQDEGKLDDALPFYRTAVRLLPGSVHYLTSLGLTEFKLGLLEKAQRRFEAILNIDSSSTTAKYYLKALASKKKKKAPVCFDDDCDQLDSPVNMQPIVELSSEEFTSCGETCLDFNTFRDYSARPFVIRGALQHLKSNLSVFSPAVLNESFGMHNVDFYPQNMLTKPTKVYTVPFSNALNYLAYPEAAYLSVDVSEPGTYIQWNMNETVWEDVLDKAHLTHLPRVLTHSMDSLFEKAAGVHSVDVLGDKRAANTAVLKHSFGQKTHWYMLLVGEEGSGMFAHQDSLAVGSWQAQVAGSKHWRICSPTPPLGAQSVLPIMGSGKNQVCYDTTVHVGDIVYYPPYYWHETKNLHSPSASLSGSVVVDILVDDSVASKVSSGDGATYRHVLLRTLQEECSNRKKGFDFDDTFCISLVE